MFSENQVISKKKEKKRSSPKFGVFFCPKSSDFQKIKIKKKVFAVIQNVFLSKKRSSPKFRVFFCPKSSDLQKKVQRSSTLTPTSFGGGLFSFLEQISAAELLKTCYFAYFSGQWGGYSTICPPLATLLSSIVAR